MPLIRIKGSDVLKAICCGSQVVAVDEDTIDNVRVTHRTKFYRLEPIGSSSSVQDPKSKWRPASNEEIPITNSIEQLDRASSETQRLLATPAVPKSNDGAAKVQNTQVAASKAALEDSTAKVTQDVSTASQGVTAAEINDTPPVESKPKISLKDMHVEPHVPSTQHEIVPLRFAADKEKMSHFEQAFADNAVCTTMVLEHLTRRDRLVVAACGPLLFNYVNKNCAKFSFVRKDKRTLDQCKLVQLQWREGEKRGEGHIEYLVQSGEKKFIVTVDGIIRGPTEAYADAHITARQTASALQYIAATGSIRYLELLNLHALTPELVTDATGCLKALKRLYVRNCGDLGLAEFCNTLFISKLDCTYTVSGDLRPSDPPMKLERTYTPRKRKVYMEYDAGYELNRPYASGPLKEGEFHIKPALAGLALNSLLEGAHTGHFELIDKDNLPLLAYDAKWRYWFGENPNPLFSTAIKEAQKEFDFCGVSDEADNPHGNEDSRNPEDVERAHIHEETYQAIKKACVTFNKWYIKHGGSAYGLESGGKSDEVFFCDTHQWLPQSMFPNAQLATSTKGLGDDEVRTRSCQICALVRALDDYDRHYPVSPHKSQLWKELDIFKYQAIDSEDFTESDFTLAFHLRLSNDGMRSVNTTAFKHVCWVEEEPAKVEVGGKPAWDDSPDVRSTPAVSNPSGGPAPSNATIPSAPPVPRAPLKRIEEFNIFVERNAARPKKMTFAEKLRERNITKPPRVVASMPQEDEPVPDGDTPAPQQTSDITTASPSIPDLQTEKINDLVTQREEQKQTSDDDKAAMLKSFQTAPASTIPPVDIAKDLQTFEIDTTKKGDDQAIGNFASAFLEAAKSGDYATSSAPLRRLTIEDIDIADVCPTSASLKGNHCRCTLRKVCTKLYCSGDCNNIHGVVCEKFMNNMKCDTETCRSGSHNEKWLAITDRDERLKHGNEYGDVEEQEEEGEVQMTFA